MALQKETNETIACRQYYHMTSRIKRGELQYGFPQVHGLAELGEHINGDFELKPFILSPWCSLT